MCFLRIWIAISRFGTPWPPFDFNSGMGIEEVDREEAEQLGLLNEGDPVEPIETDFNRQLESGVQTQNLDPRLISAMKTFLGDQLDTTGTQVSWRSDLIRDLVATAISNPTFKGNVGLGTLGPRAAAKILNDLGQDLYDHQFDLSADAVRHAWKRHGEESGTHDRKLRREHFEIIPLVLREADVVEAGDKPDRFVLKKRIGEVLWVVFWEKSSKRKLMTVRSVRMEKSK